MQEARRLNLPTRIKQVGPYLWENHRHVVRQSGPAVAAMLLLIQARKDWERPFSIGASISTIDPKPSLAHPESGRSSAFFERLQRAYEIGCDSYGAFAAAIAERARICDFHG
jgi:hypothetical protein